MSMPFIRKLRKNNFHECYEDTCKLLNVFPLTSVLVHKTKKSLDFFCDNLKFEEWRPVFTALGNCKDLHFISFRCKNRALKVNEEINTESKARYPIKYPIIFTKYMLTTLIKHLNKCLEINKELISLEFDGFPLTTEYLQVLAKGINKSFSLKYVSFHNCHIKNEGAAIVCQILRANYNILSIDFTGCDLDDESAWQISNLIEFQNLERYSEHWHYSLRSRQPKNDLIPGIRRFILNSNKISDEGLQFLVNSLSDDHWIKAIDLQNNNITDKGAIEILDLLNINTDLRIFDLRSSTNVDPKLSLKILNVLQSREDDQFNFHWISPCRINNKKINFTNYTNQKENLNPMKSKGPWRANERIHIRKMQSETSGIPWMMKLKDKKPENKVYENDTGFNMNNYNSAPVKQLMEDLKNERIKRFHAEQEVEFLREKLDHFHFPDKDRKYILVEEEFLIFIKKTLKLFSEFIHDIQNESSYQISPQMDLKEQKSKTFIKNNKNDKEEINHFKLCSLTKESNFRENFPNDNSSDTESKFSKYSSEISDIHNLRHLNMNLSDFTNILNKALLSVRTCDQNTAL